MRADHPGGRSKDRAGPRPCPGLESRARAHDRARPHLQHRRPRPRLCGLPRPLGRRAAAPRTGARAARPRQARLAGQAAGRPPGRRRHDARRAARPRGGRVLLPQAEQHHRRRLGRPRGGNLLAYGLLRRAGEGNPVPALELGVWLTASFAVGVAGSVAAGQVATSIAVRTGIRAAFGVRQSTDLAVRIAVRGGAVSGLFVTATSLLGTAGLFTAVLAYKGVFGASQAAALRVAPKIPS